MNSTLTVNNQELMIKEFNEIRVVHMWDIAKLHGTTVKHIRMNFENNKNHLIENEDYFFLDKEDNLLVNLIDQSDISRHAVYRSKNIPVFTESGYLMMTKPMTDEISWNVQRQLVNCYFKVREVVKEAVEKEVKPELKSLADVNKTIELLSGMYDSMKVPNEDKLKTIKALLETAGLSIPEVEVPKEIDKSNYISIEEIAKRAGLYDKYSRLNVEAVAIAMKAIGMTPSDYHVVISTNSQNDVIYSVYYTPKLVIKISDYLRKENYPQFLERELLNGDIKRTLVVYKDKDFHIHKK